MNYISHYYDVKILEYVIFMVLRSLLQRLTISWVRNCDVYGASFH